MRLWSVTFAGPLDLPGKSGATRVYAWHPDFASMGGFHIELDLAKRLVRLEVPEQARRNGLGSYFDKKRPMHFLGAVQYIPLEQVRAFEAYTDAEKDAEPAALAAPKKPPEPALKKG